MAKRSNKLTDLQKQILSEANDNPNQGIIIKDILFGHREKETAHILSGGNNLLAQIEDRVDYANAIAALHKTIDYIIEDAVEKRIWDTRYNAGLDIEKAMKQPPKKLFQDKLREIFSTFNLTEYQVRLQEALYERDYPYSEAKAEAIAPYIESYIENNNKILSSQVAYIIHIISRAEQGDDNQINVDDYDHNIDWVYLQTDKDHRVQRALYNILKLTE